MLLRSSQARWMCLVCLLFPAAVLAQPVTTQRGDEAPQPVTTEPGDEAPLPDATDYEDEAPLPKTTDYEDEAPLPKTTDYEDEASLPDTADYDVETSFKVYPTPIWSRSAGFAAGVGYEIEHLFFPRTNIVAKAKPGQHLGRYSLTYVARDRYEDPVYGLANVYYATTGRQWYYGIGPATSKEHEIGVEKEMVEFDVRVGFRPLGGRLLLQPSAKYLRHEVHGFEEFDEDALDRMSEASRVNLLYAVSGPEVADGFAVGGSVGIDLRDRQSRTRRGILLQGSAHRYLMRTEPDIEFDRFEGYAYFFVPVGDNRLALRLATQLTETRAQTAIPFYLLPSLNGRLLPGYSWNRFYGNDLLVASLEYALPLFQFYEFAAMDLLLSVGAGNVYNDLFDEFKPAITFERNLEPASEYPLRPSAAVGFTIQSFDAGGWDVRILLGLGTEGVRLVQFAFVHEVREYDLTIW